MSTSFYIIDDEMSSILLLSQLLENITGGQILGFNTNPQEALKELASGKIQPDITFLDIDMPDISGLELAPLIMPYTTVIFITAHPDFAPQSYDLGIVDFIVKPVTFLRLEKAISRAVKEVEERKAKQRFIGDYIYLFAERRRKRIKLLFEETIYLESQSNNVKIVTLHEPIRIHDSLDNLERLLPGERFMRVHRSFLINLGKITAYEDGMVTLAQKITIPVGRKYKSLFLERMGF